MSQANLPPQQPAGGGAKLVVVALLLALATVILTNIYIEVVKRQVEEKSFTVYRLNKMVKVGERLRQSNWEKVDLPESFQDSVKSMGAMDLTALKNKVNQPFMKDAPQGSILTYDLFEARDSKRTDLQIAAGMVQMSLPIDSKLQPGSLMPKMYVDIAAPFQTGGQIPEVMTVMERVQVLALGTYVVSEEEESQRSHRAGSYRTITIMVKPDVALQLSMVDKMAAGEFELHVRNPNDDTVPKIPVGTVNPRVLDLLRDRLPKDTGTKLGG